MDNAESSAGFVRLSGILAPRGPNPCQQVNLVGGSEGGALPQAGEAGPRITAWRVEDVRALIEKPNALAAIAGQTGRGSRANTATPSRKRRGHSISTATPCAIGSAAEARPHLVGVVTAAVFRDVGFQFNCLYHRFSSPFG